jgi:HD-GYP domain-containing protein (c-di-GMP phosphodiesterase class II)
MVTRNQNVNMKDNADIEKKLKIYQEEHQRLKTLLNITRNISREIELESLLITIMDEVKKALMADRCTVFLIDKERNEIWSKVAHGKDKIRFPVYLGIAGHVATTGEVLNISDAYSDKRFNPTIDRQTGYRTTNMLTFPMRNKLKEIIGVFQVLNKHDGAFTGEDENLLGVISTIAAAQLENAQLYEEQKKTLDSFVETLASTIDARDPVTAGHSSRIALYSDHVAKILNLSHKRREILRYSALLHDFGKIAVREDVLYKNGRLTIEEYCKIQEHPAYTKSILEKINFSRDFKDVPQIAAAHHEKMDGSGYPEGLPGNRIPLESRILSVVDVFDALTSKRHYRDRMEFEKVMDNLEKNCGNQFDKNIFDAFKQIKIGNVLSILEIDNRDKLEIQDIEFLSRFKVILLMSIIKNGPISSDEKEILTLFNKYYYREHLTGFQDKFNQQLKVASI